MRSRQRTFVLVCLICGALFFPITLSASKAQAQQGSSTPSTTQSGQTDLGEVGAKLANPLNELWSLQTNFEMPKFYDGDVNTGKKADGPRTHRRGVV